MTWQPHVHTKNNRSEGKSQRHAGRQARGDCAGRRATTAVTVQVTGCVANATDWPRVCSGASDLFFDLHELTESPASRQQPASLCHCPDVQALSVFLALWLPN